MDDSLQASGSLFWDDGESIGNFSFTNIPIVNDFISKRAHQSKLIE